MKKSITIAGITIAIVAATATLAYASPDKPLANASDHAQTSQARTISLVSAQSEVTPVDEPTTVVAQTAATQSAEEPTTPDPAPTPEPAADPDPEEDPVVLVGVRTKYRLTTDRQREEVWCYYDFSDGDSVPFMVGIRPIGATNIIFDCPPYGSWL
jgi:hypothetical protein